MSVDGAKGSNIEAERSQGVGWKALGLGLENLGGGWDHDAGRRCGWTLVGPETAMGAIGLVFKGLS